MLGNLFAISQLVSGRARIPAQVFSCRTWFVTTEPYYLLTRKFPHFALSQVQFSGSVIRLSLKSKQEGPLPCGSPLVMPPPTGSRNLRPILDHAPGSQNSGISFPFLTPFHPPPWKNPGIHDSHRAIQVLAKRYLSGWEDGSIIFC